MNNLTKTANTLDKLLKVFYVLVDIAAVCQVIGLGIIAAGFLFDLDPFLIGTNYEMADLGFMTLTVANDYMPDIKFILYQAAEELFLSLLCLIVARFMIRCIRNILSPMKTGEPFHNTVSTNLKQLAKYTCSLGIALNLREIISSILLVKAYNLPELIVGDTISRVTFDYTFDLSFLLIWAILLLLSYIFQYGEQLQQLSDETL